MSTKKLTLKQKVGRIKYYALMWIIEFLRKFSQHNLYLVAGQLHTRNTDPIDSWQLFLWLQKNNIPSRYVVNSDDVFYLQNIKDKGLKDIVVLDGNGSTTQILQHIGLWIHARAFIAEWNLEIPFLNKWLQRLPDMRWVMLNHGVCALWSDSQFIDGFKTFNDINVSSQNESDFLSSQMPQYLQGRCYVGGLPRFENLTDQADHSAKEKTLFVMFTWRNRNGMKWEDFSKSYYWQGVSQLLSASNVERLKRQNINMVVSLHHSLLRILPDLELPTNIKIVPSKDVRYWISHAHCLITDFSSVAFDFLFLQKPVVFWIPDLNDPTLDPNDLGYGSKVLSAIERRKYFFNTAETLEDALSMLEQYAQNNCILEAEKIAIANQWMTNRSDFSRHVYEGLEKRINEDRR